MREAVVFSTARTPIGRDYRGAFNDTEAPTLGRPRDTPCRRACRARTGLPVTVGGMTVDRQCASGMTAIAVAARSIIRDGVDFMIGGGQGAASLFEIA